MKRIKRTSYDGTKNRIESLLAPVNHEIVNQNVKYIPKWIETYHLTGLTYIWVILVVIGGILSQYSLLAVWICLLALVGHIISDAFDGALGRYRNTGLVKWGYYVDHFGDYLLSCSLVVSFRLIEPRLNEYLIMFLAFVITGFFVHSLLSTVTLNRYTLTFFKLFSPLEGQMVYVFVYVAVLIFGRWTLMYIIPVIGIVASIALTYLVGITIYRLWILETKILKNKLYKQRKRRIAARKRKLEARKGIEPLHRSFADSRVTTSPPRR